ncbi:MAG TPA: hypothetical protein VIQ80_00945 [Candidatus Saccharimonadales bacterium]
MTQTKKRITQLLAKEMNRKDFLKYSGGVLLAAVGVTGLLNTLLRLGGEDDKKGGYGTSAYGR